MINQRIKLGIAIASSLVLARSLPSDSLEFSVDEGLSLTKSFKTTSRAYLEEMTIEVDGNDIGAMLGDMEVESVGETELIFSDVYLLLDADRVTQLERTFDELSNSTLVSFGFQFGAEAQDIAVNSELDGETVIFNWAPDQEDYSVSFEDPEGRDEKLLRSLEFETDMRFFLPPNQVEEGDTWEVPLVGFKQLLMPGGDLVWMPEEMPDMDMEAFGEIGEEIKERAEELLMDALKGEAVCTFGGVSEVQGVRLGSIEINTAFDLDLDLLPFINEFMESILDELPMELPIEFNFESLLLELSFNSEGLALWNMQAGHLHSLSMQSEVDFSIEIAVVVDAEGEIHEAEMSMDMSMDMDNEVSFSE